MGSAAFVAYLSVLCNVAYTATQYALFSSLMAVGRTILSSGSGWVADRVEWIDLLPPLDGAGPPRAPGAGLDAAPVPFARAGRPA